MCKKLLCVVLSLILLLSCLSYAHSGRTDGKGGHHDRIHGGYHYHHGYYAHDHPDGVCPIIEAKRLEEKNEEPNNEFLNLLKILGSMFLLFFLFPLLFFFVIGIFDKKSNKDGCQNSTYREPYQRRKYDKTEYLLRQHKTHRVNLDSLIVHHYDSDEAGYVYRTENSLCFHKFNCYCLSHKTKYKISIENAKKHGLTPCKRCKP